MQFTKTFTQKYPNVKLLMSSEVPSDEVLKQNPRAISITTLTLAKESDMRGGASPSMSSLDSKMNSLGSGEEKDAAVFSHNRIPPVVNYEKNNNVCVFSYSKVIQKSPQKKPDNEFKVGRGSLSLRSTCPHFVVVCAYECHSLPLKLCAFKMEYMSQCSTFWRGTSGHSESKPWSKFSNVCGHTLSRLTTTT